MEPLTISEIYDVSVEKLWKAITDQEEMKVWYFDIPNFKLEKGFVFEFYEPGEERKYLHRCEILDFKTNTFLKYSWAHPDFSNGVTMVLWELEEKNEKTKLKLSHLDLENIADAGEGFQREKYKEGWEQILGTSLHGFLETK